MKAYDKITILEQFMDALPAISMTKQGQVGLLVTNQPLDLETQVIDKRISYTFPLRPQTDFILYKLVILRTPARNG
jgi:hypothetical protein